MIDDRLTEAEEKAMMAELVKSSEFKRREALRDKLMKAGRYLEAAREQAYLNAVIKKTRQALIEQAEEKTHNMLTVFSKMSDEDVTTTNIRLNMLFVLSDILESTTMEIRATLQRYMPECDYVEFNELLRACKQQRLRMWNLTTQQYQDLFADHTDNLTEMVYNKVKSIIRKAKEKEDGKS